MIFDVIIIGSGPAGVTAGIYASRHNLKTILIAENIGGQLSDKAVLIENYTGFNSISGIDLAQKFDEHLSAQENIQFEFDIVSNIEKKQNFIVNEKYEGKTVIVAAGSKPRKLNIKGEEEFIGKGVSYCALCDGPLFKEKKVAIIGGGNAGFETALYLSEIVEEVYLLEKGDYFVADEINQKKVKNNSKIKTILNANIKEIKGDDFVKSIKYNDAEIEIDGVFIYAGRESKVDFLGNLVDFNKRGEIIVDEDKETKTKGLFAAGDVTNSKVKQIICAASDGAIASISAYNYIKNEQ